MNIQEAFETLGLEITSTKLEIKESHRNLIKDFHSDKENGDHGKSSQLNSARDIALKYVDEKVNISLIKQVFDIVNINNNVSLQQTEYKAQSDSIYNKISRKFGSRYKSYKSAAKTFGLISAIIALLSSKLLPLLPEAAKDPTVTIPFIVFTVISGLFYLIMNSAAERIQDSIDDLKDTLSDKASYYDILNDILQFQNVQSKNFSRHELEKLCDEWFHVALDKYSSNNSLDKAFQDVFLIVDTSFRSTVRRIGVHDFMKFLISKGLEKNIIIEKEISDSGLTEIKYEIN